MFSRFPSPSSMQVTFLHALAAAITLLPLFFLDLTSFAGNSDALFYSVILKLTAERMAAGQLFPDWIMQANGGIGSPALYYYSPLAYQLTAILGIPLSFIDPLGWKRLVFGIFAAQWIGGVCAYRWLSRRNAANASLAASLFFTLVPYKLIYIYLHINMAQLWALACLPLLMVAAENMARGARKSTCWYGLAAALLILMHPRTFIAFALVPALYAVFFSADRLRTLLSLAAAHLLAFMLSAFYLLPAFFNLELVQVASANAGRMFYADNLSHKDLIYNFYYAVIAAMVIGLMIRKPELQKKELIFWLSVLMAVALLCLRISKPVWDHIPLLQMLQFPVARLHAVALIAGCSLVAAVWVHGRQKPLPYFYSPYALIFCIAVMAGFTLSYIRDVYKEARTNDITWSYIEDFHKLNIILPPEYLTRWQPAGSNDFLLIQQLSQQPAARLVAGTGTANATFSTSGITLEADIESDSASVQLHQLYWPVWDNTDLHMAADKNGLMTIELTKGHHALTIRRKPLKGETAGAILSLLALLMLAIRLKKA